MMRITLPNLIVTDLYQLDEAAQAELRAAETEGKVYCWKTIGRSNWLEHGFSVADVLGIVVLPEGFPDYIEMPDDVEEHSESAGQQNV